MGLNAVGSTDATSRDTFTGFFMACRRLQIHMRKQTPFSSPKTHATKCHHQATSRPSPLAIAATAFTLPNLLALL
jgi:hypothetical protein